MLIVDCLQFCADILIVLPQNEQNEHLKWLQNESSDNISQLLDIVYYKQKNKKKPLYIYVIQEGEAILWENIIRNCLNWYVEASLIMTTYDTSMFVSTKMQVFMKSNLV